jgi:hypothetical protein
VLPEIIIELADTPIERIEQAIAHGQARPEVHDLAGWVVKLLRAARDYGWTIPQARPTSANSPARAYQIDIDRYTSGAYGDLFRRGGDTSDLEPSFQSPISSLQSPVCQLPTADALTERLRERLLLSCDRPHRGVIQRLHIEVAGDITLIRYATLADAQIVQDQLLGAIRLAIAEQGGPPAIRLTAQPPGVR